MIAIAGLGVTFGRGTVLETRALAGVDLAIPEGEFVTVIGSNGAGKSTLFRAVVGLLKYKTGGVWFGGDDISRMGTHRISRRGLAYVAAERHLFAHMTVAENLTLGAYPRRAAVARQIEQTGMTQAADRLGLDGMLALWHPPGAN